MTYGSESECATHYTTAPHYSQTHECNDNGLQCQSDPWDSQTWPRLRKTSGFRRGVVSFTYLLTYLLTYWRTWCTLLPIISLTKSSDNVYIADQPGPTRYGYSVPLDPKPQGGGQRNKLSVQQTFSFYVSIIIGLCVLYVDNNSYEDCFWHASLLVWVSDDCSQAALGRGVDFSNVTIIS